VSVEINNDSGVPVDLTALEALAEFVLARMKLHPMAELSIELVDVEAMTALHERFMNEPGPTDVLAFPMDELRPTTDDDDELAEGLLGDVVLCPQVAQEQAQGAGHTMTDELNLLCTHGILHLLGYDHHSPDEEREMFGLQARLLAAWLGELNQA
jgi:probable rRNA maturation factor